MRAVIQIIACAPSPVVYATCGAAVAGMTLATGGSLGDAAKAVAFSFASMGIFDQIGLAFGDLGAMIKEVGVVGASVLKGGVHGVVGGALSLAQGGSFQEGFAANAIGAVTGVLTGAMQFGNMIADTAIVAAAGCGGAVLSGGKCATGAVTAAFANMYNKFRNYGRTQAWEQSGGGGNSGGGAASGSEFGVAAFLRGLISIFTYSPADVGTRSDEMRSIYRAVDETELEYLSENGDYGHSPSQGGKYFSKTLAGAVAFSKSSINQGNTMTITGTEIPKSVYNQGHHFMDPGVTGAGPSIHFMDAQLPTVYKTMTRPVKIFPNSP